jgi:BlaI family transcriptional regulator, penicillinase repressor
MSSESRQLSRRERQIMDIIYARGEATGAEVSAAMPDAPSYSALRTLLRILEQKGHLRHREDGPRYVYLPVESHEKAGRSALSGVVKTFFDGSLANAVAALVGCGRKPSAEELKRIEEIIKAAKAKTKGKS